MPAIATRSATTVARVRISHPDRLIYPDAGISKLAQDVSKQAMAALEQL